MELKLLRIIYDYTKQRKIIDRKFLDKFIEIVVNYKSLDDYVKFVTFSEEIQSKDSGTILASYNHLLKRIRVNYYSIVEYLENFENKYCYFSDFENLFLKNLEIVQLILHELEHANQFNKCENSSTYESMLLRESLFCSNNNLYKSAYNYAPEERLANIISYREIINILNYIKELVPNLLNFENYKLLDYAINDYQIIDSNIIPPTIYYFFIGNMNESLRRLGLINSDGTIKQNIENEFDYEKRLTYGLSISNYEFHSLHNQVNSMNRFE